MRSDSSERAWAIFAPSNHPLRPALETAFSDCPGIGAVCLVSPGPPGATGEFLLRSTQRALAGRPSRLVFLLTGNPAAAAFARSVWLEHPEIAITVVHTVDNDERVVPWAAAEAQNASGFVECSYDKLGQRREPRLVLLPALTPSPGPALSSSDILLVTGGGKGIAAESALGLARSSRCRLVLLGRSAPELDNALASNLTRLSAAGIEFRYERADVTAAAELQDVLRRVQGEWGAITAVLHGAGVNTPKPIESLQARDLQRTLAPKLQGLDNLLSSIDAQRLTTLVTFGSLIARSGMAGEADYAFANATLADRVEAWQASHPHCRCLNLEWSVWAGTGMGQRLGVIDSLKRQGIDPIGVDDGIRFLQEALKREDLPVSTIVTSRFARQATLKLQAPEIPLLRFLEETRVHFPGVELIADAEVSLGNDPYLLDHVLEGEHLFPAVMGLEAMAQVARALCESPLLPRFLNVRFDRPIVVSPKKALRIRIVALQTAEGHVRVAIRSAETAFQSDHFHAECIFGDVTLETAPSLPAGQPDDEVPGVRPDSDLYGNILFHKGRFQRVGRYHRVRAHESIAEIHPAGTDHPWFGRHLPQDLVLGDAAARDAAIHSVQVCVPSTTLVPISVESIMVDSAWGEQAAEVRASERGSRDGIYVYDLEVVDQDGRVRERWEGIRYRGLQDGKQRRRFTPALLVPHLERGFAEMLSEAAVRITIDHEGGGRSLHPLLHRPDGRPELPGSVGARMSISRAGGLTFSILSNGAAGCDVEPASERKGEDWKALLGAKGWALAESVASAARESVDTAATRVWAARESLLKAGALNGEPLLLDEAREDGWVSFRAGAMKGASSVVSVRGHERPLVFAVMLENSPEEASPTDATKRRDFHLSRHRTPRHGNFPMRA